ncbi:MAG: hypothetical protein IT236_03640 [Bacteroidia bacterium]|nr:hypothetical protein [Bacteroidia bacterium]
MKKTIVALALTLTGANLFGQDLTSKKGEAYLPEAGDWGLGIDATPFLQYGGNFFGKTSTNSAPTFNFLGGYQTITGKYFVDASKAYRGALRIGIGSNTDRNMVTDRTTTLSAANFPSVDPMKENTWKHSTTNIGLSGGMEFRKGKTRLQGYYGGEAAIFFGSSKDVFTYGNALNTGTTNPVGVTSADSFLGANNIQSVPSQGSIGSGRVLERKNGSSFSFGLRGFVGVEYFIWPKISLGGEFGWGLGITSLGKSTTTIESIGNKGGTNNDEIGTTTVTGSKGGVFSLDTDNSNSFCGPSGSIRLNFHF